MPIPTFLARAAILAMAVAGLSATASAQTPKQIGTFGAWQAYAAGAKPTTCYISAKPTKSEPAAAKRGDIFLLVTFRKGADGKTASRNEVSLIAGYTYKDQSDVELTASGLKYLLFTQGDGAWARDARTDDEIVGALKRARSLTVKGTSARGTATTDTFSLDGFEKAMAAATKACGIKPAA